MTENILKSIIEIIKLLLGLKVSFITLLFSLLVYFFAPEIINNQKNLCFFLILFCVSVITINLICILYDKYGEYKNNKYLKENYPEIEEHKKLKIKIALEQMKEYEEMQRNLR